MTQDEDQGGYKGPEYTGPGSAPEPAEGTNTRDGEPSNVVQHPRSNGGGRPIDESPPAETDDEQLEFFEAVNPNGKDFAFNDIIAKARRQNLPIEMRFVMTGKSIPSMSGLLDPYATSHLLLADCVVDHIKPQFIRDENRKVEGLILYCSVKPVGVADARSEQGQAWLKEKIGEAA